LNNNFAFSHKKETTIVTREMNSNLVSESKRRYKQSIKLREKEKGRDRDSHQLIIKRIKKEEWTKGDIRTHQYAIIDKLHKFRFANPN